MTDKPRLDVHQAITDRIVELMETAPDKVRMPWHRTGTGTFLPKNAVTTNLYNGINVLSLWATAEVKGYTHGLWATYKQWQSVDAQVKKGEKSALVVFYKEFDTDPNPDDAEDDGRRRVAKASYVFNVDQVEGYELPAQLPELGPVQRLDKAEAFVRATGANIRIGGQSAFYRPSADYIQMPDEHLFRADGYQRTEDWYSVLSHELGHWSGAKGRLARDLSGQFGSDSYAMEELVAELTSSFLCAELGISSTPRPDHAHYIAHWLQLCAAPHKVSNREVSVMCS